MINANGGSNGGTTPSVNEKTIQDATKIIALKDVQNENVGTVHKQPENFMAGVRHSNEDAVKVSGAKRSVRNVSSQPYGTNENIVNANRRFDLELGRGRLQNSMERFTESKNMGQLRQLIPPSTTHLKDFSLRQRQVPVTPPNPTSAAMVLPSDASSVPHLEKNQNSNSTAKVSPASNRDDSKNTKDRMRAERFIRLQEFLKQCNDSNPKGYIETLSRMTSSELSKHAVKLEKKAIQLTIDEGIEIERMRTLGILAKSSPSTVLLQSPEALNPHKVQMLT